MLTMDHILVTGGAGYIGSHACKALAKLGYTPVTLDNLSTGWDDAVKFGPLIQADLRDRSALDAAFATYKPSAVMHFAALSQVSQATQEPGLYWRNNVLGSLNLIEAMVDAGCPKLVFSSTCATYGDHDGVLLTEQSPQHPTNAYGASKRASEEIIKHFADIHDLKAVTFRYFNVAGADPECEIGEWHHPETHLIPLILDSVSGKRGPLSIYGTDYPTRDGTCIRDYVHVMDLVDAHIRGLNWLNAGRGSRIFNLGTGTGFSVKEIITACEATLRRQVPHATAPRRPGDAASLVSGSFRALQDLNWRPQRSDLGTMITDAWRWHLKGGYASDAEEIPRI